MPFNDELKFEEALVKLLQQHGWDKDVINYPTEKDLIQNWADILFENNRGIDRLNDYPLTEGEMGQILDQIKALRTPLRLSGFINGGSVAVKRDNPDDVAHFGKEISLKIYDRREIAAGQSRYQIVRQPQFPTKSKIQNDRRGDVMLLINGMPVIHIELKKSGIPVSRAANQIEKYAREGIFTGLFALVQIFVAMNPEETLYFANPGPDGRFNPDYYFHWADFDNEPINDWRKIAESLLSIPLAHQLIGFYTVADDSDGVLKVMRSYQYYAANRISDAVAKRNWKEKNQLGGYVWHTTGSGKTMTSFKSAELIATSRDADKVVFVVDRIELGTQSLNEYRNFAGAGLTEEQKSQTVHKTEDTRVLINLLTSSDPADTLIVTSIQKLSRVNEKNEVLKADDIAKARAKRIVMIFDEAHRSTFGDMLWDIKKTFPGAMLFGFTGTPIYKENQKKLNTTASVFGNELHRYIIADGIRDKNVLGFDPYMVLTFNDADVREQVALKKAKAKTSAEALADPKKKQVFLKYMNELPMAGYQKDGTYHKGIEDELPTIQYRTEKHIDKVVEDILDHWTILSQNGKFHAMFATNSIPEAITYYQKFKEKKAPLNITALFDPNIDNTEGAAVKEEGLIEIIEDYNARYGQDFNMATFGKMKKDIAARLAHKRPYERIERTPEKQIDLLIVVDQMLTGFDSKWINTLYLDKVLEYEGLIQAFSRTNRLFGPDKPFGTIKYYRRPHTMKRNIDVAFETYAGENAPAVYAERLPKNLERMNFYFKEITDVFEGENIVNFEKLPDDEAAKKQFAKSFRQFNQYLEAAKVQGFIWEQSDYTFPDHEPVTVLMDERTYYILVMRYKELDGGGGPGIGDDVPYDLDGYLTTIDTEKIDTDYMNKRFDKFLKLLNIDDTSAEELKKAEDDLHKSFASLTREEQKFANLLLHDIQSGDMTVDPGKTFRDYIVDYMTRSDNDRLRRMADALGLDESLLRAFKEQNITEANINEFGRFDELKKTVDKAKAKAYFEAASGQKMPIPKVNRRIDDLLRKFILKDEFDMPDDTHREKPYSFNLAQETSMAAEEQATFNE